MGTFATVFLGDLAGTAGKTLTINPAATGMTNRIRVYGVNTVYNANLVLNNMDSPSSEAIYNGTVLAPYLPNGTQTYNGVISGVGGIAQRGNGTTILSGLNTYTGGTFITAGTVAFGIDSSPTVGTVTAGPIGVGPLFVSPEVNTAAGTGGTGQVMAFGGSRTIANPIQYPSGTNNQLLVVRGSNDLTFTGPFTLNGVDLVGPATNRTIQVTNTGLTSFSGVISDAGMGYGLIKTGTGTLALNNAETYTGPTTNSAGILQVNGSLVAASVVSVATNATLAGTGTINGPVTIYAGGGLAPGAGGVGTLTINNTLSLATNSTTSIEVNKGAGSTHDLVTGLTSVTNGGTLSATNLSGNLNIVENFTIFSTASHTGNFNAITGSPGAGLAWAFNPGTGVLSVIAGVYTNATNITFTASATSLTLNWPSNHTGWRLQTQTNAAGAGVTTNWVTVAGSTNVNQVVAPLTTNGSVFYRMVYP